MSFQLSVFLAACVAIDPGTTLTRCKPIKEENFATQLGCAAKAREIIVDKTKKAICVEDKI